MNVYENDRSTLHVNNVNTYKKPLPPRIFKNLLIFFTQFVNHLFKLKSIDPSSLATMIETAKHA